MTAYPSFVSRDRFPAKSRRRRFADAAAALALYLAVPAALAATLRLVLESQESGFGPCHRVQKLVLEGLLVSGYVLMVACFVLGIGALVLGTRRRVRAVIGVALVLPVYLIVAATNPLVCP